MRISDWSSDVCSSDLHAGADPRDGGARSGGGGDRHGLRDRRYRRAFGAEFDDRESAEALDVADRARLPDVVRVRAAMHLDDRDHAARDQRLEMARLHGWLFARARLHRFWSDLLEDGKSTTLNSSN